ncbi:PilZ domain-containing protein [Marinobacter sp. X15-166B]|uniref:PilZ domain-containing protein n=1 Tax=Marinobacter sp. X15-166B TaxID=1897620 RepID=UPI00085C281F|nr:PilZ domain-containing protein [Marinobacter sp. X15-166B]OEY67344.1 pilus assembly protein PilZ [Marinobacter sp. X15-166B]
MTTSNRRVHIRTPMSATVKVSHPVLGEIQCATRDISDGGIFIAVDDQAYGLALGDSVQVQVQGLAIPAPVLSMQVVRVMEDGFGLQFENS